MKKLILMLIPLLVLTFTVNSHSEVIPDELEEIAEECQEEYSVSKYLLLSLVYEECRFDVEEVDGNVTQITNTTWFEEGIEHVKAKNPKTDVRENMKICSYYLSKWMENEAEGEPMLACRMWNQGFENALKTPNATSYYSRSIVRRADRWQEELEGGNG